MKIVSRRSKKIEEVDIFLDLREIEEDVLPPPPPEPEQEVFEFYDEDWVIQGAKELGCEVSFDPLSCYWIFTYQGELVAKLSVVAAQSCGDLALVCLRDTINHLTSIGAAHEAHDN